MGQPLNAQNYSWVDVRSKGMVVIGVFDWKAEMASHDVGDAAIENSGNNLREVEVGYRKNSGDDNTYMYFYRSREEVEAAAQAAKQRAERRSQSGGGGEGVQRHVEAEARVAALHDLCSRMLPNR
jgi:hypothetical protein